MSDVRIVMIGKTGVGKSATGNTIMGQKVFEEKLCSELVTKTCQQHQHIVESKLISVIDTPGLFDKYKYTIMKCVEMSVPGPHAFLLLIRLDVKFTEEEKITVKWIEDNFTADAARYTIILFTRGDQLHTSIEKFLTDNKQIKELVSKCKGGYHVFNNKDKENRTQVTELLKKIDRMVKENGGKHYTDEMYKEALKRQREEDERRRLEEEENMKKKERFKNMNKAKKAALVAAGMIGSGVGGAAAVAGGVALAALSVAVSPVSLLIVGGALTVELGVSENEKAVQKKEAEMKRDDT